MNENTPIEGTHKTTATSLLHPDEPQPCLIVKGNSPLIIAGPHNGHFVPRSLYEDDRPLGLHASSFDPQSPFKRHESCDWGVAELFKHLQKLDNKSEQAHTYISGQYSRLVCDLNRTTQHSITAQSSETNTTIPGNINLDETDETARLAAIYSPYHQQLRSTIKETREHFGYAIFLDLHSYTPIWDGKKRLIQVSTTACSDHPVEKIIATHMGKACSTQNLVFAEHEPYDLKTLPKLAATAHKIEEIGVWYTGLEIRNDLLEGAQYMQNMAYAIHEMAKTLTEHHDKEIFAKAPKSLVPA